MLKKISSKTPTNPTLVGDNVSAVTATVGGGSPTEQRLAEGAGNLGSPQLFIVLYTVKLQFSFAVFGAAMRPDAQAGSTPPLGVGGGLLDPELFTCQRRELGQSGAAEASAAAIFQVFPRSSSVFQLLTATGARGCFSPRNTDFIRKYFIFQEARTKKKCDSR